MIQKLKNMIVVAAASLTLFAPAAVAITVSSASADTVSQVCTGVNIATNNGTGPGCGTAGTGSNASGLSSIATKIVNLFSIIVGIVAVIMIIYGGFRYITSGGASDSVGNAKNTIIFAIVGLIVVALAQFIVHFVLNTATSSGISNT